MTAKSVIFTAEADYDPGNLNVEDSGCAQIYTFDDPTVPIDEEGMFVRIQSWSDRCKHPAMDRLNGKRIRVTIEILG